ncbi:unnamed protein product, partial [Pleuronectes platessa]
MSPQEEQLNPSRREGGEASGTRRTQRLPDAQEDGSVDPCAQLRSERPLNLQSTSPRSSVNISEVKVERQRPDGKTSTVCPPPQNFLIPPCWADEVGLGADAVDFRRQMGAELHGRWLGPAAWGGGSREESEVGGSAAECCVFPRRSVPEGSAALRCHVVVRVRRSGTEATERRTERRSVSVCVSGHSVSREPRLHGPGADPARLCVDLSLR